MTDRDALLAAVLAHPDDDMRRLVLADYLDENGSPADRIRAGFIRRQCDRLANYAPNVPLSVLVELEPYLDGHLQPHQYEFNVSRRGEAEVRYWLDRYRLQWAFFYRRGFVDEIRCPLVAWLEHGPGLVRRHPVTRVGVTDREPWDFGGRGEFGWFSEGGPEVTNRATLPRALSRQLGILFGRRFPSREDASNALSAGCLAWARQQSGGKGSEKGAEKCRES